MIIHRDGKNFFGLLLSNDVGVKKFFDFFRFRQNILWGFLDRLFFFLNDAPA